MYHRTGIPDPPVIIAIRPSLDGASAEVVAYDYQGLQIDLRYSAQGAHGYSEPRDVARPAFGLPTIPVAPSQSILVQAQTSAPNGRVSGWTPPVSFAQPRAPAPPHVIDRLEKRVLHFQDVLRQVTYPGWDFRVSTTGEAIYLQIMASDTCNVTGGQMLWRSGKWLLSEHMLDEEVVQKALKAVITALEHEAREKFLYRGRAIFGPHYNLDMLWETCGAPGAQVQRSPAHGGAPGAQVQWSPSAGIPTETASAERAPADGRAQDNAAPAPPSMEPTPSEGVYIGLTRGVPMWPDRAFAGTLSNTDLRKLEERVASRVRDVDQGGTAIEASLVDIHDEIKCRGVQPAFSPEGEPINHLFR